MGEVKRGEVKTLDELIGIREDLRADGKIIVTTSGCFDVLHAAHVRFFEKAKNEGDVLAIFLNSDDSVRANKGPERPIYSQNDRAYVLAAIRWIDYVTIFDELEPLELIRTIQPDVHVKGGSYIPERIEREKELVESFGGRYAIFPLEEGYSSTKGIEALSLKKA